MATTTESTLSAWNTGAGSHEAAQTDADSSIGNYRSSTRSRQLWPIVSTGFTNLTLVRLSGANQPGLGVIVALDATTLAYTGPDGTQGTGVAIANGETKVLQDGTDPEKFVEVTRTNATAFNPGAKMRLDCVDVYHNATGKSTWDDTDQGAGNTRYRCIGLLAATGEWTGRLKAYLGTLGTSALVDAGGYAAAGGVTITAKGGTDFDDWPDSGAVYNVTQDEVLYYASRTDSALTVAAAGRDVWGDGLAAGLADDVLQAVPMCRLGMESPSAQPGGNFTVIADDETAPIGVTFTHPITFDAGAAGPVGLSAGEQAAVWVEYKIIAGATAEATQLVRLFVGFNTGAGWGHGGWGSLGWGTFSEVSTTADYTLELRGRHRIADLDLEEYWVWHGAGAEPDTTGAPDYTSALLPVTSGALGAGQTHYFSTGRRSRYALETRPLNSWRVILAGDGTAESWPPTAPVYVQVAAAAAGTVQIDFDYRAALDLAAYRADTWNIYITTTGVDPDPAVDTPTTQAMLGFLNEPERLRYTTGAYANGTDVRVLVRTYSSVTTEESTNTTVYQVTAATGGPGAATSDGAFYGATAAEN